MKRYILTIVLAVAFGLNLNAQSKQQSGFSDGFFSSNYSEYREDEWAGDMPLLPGAHGSGFDYDADKSEPVPAGSGLLILTGLGLGYASLRRKKSN